jgi:2-aminoadipate transaminase
VPEVVIRSAAWQAEDFCSGYAGPRNMPAKGSHRQTLPASLSCWQLMNRPAFSQLAQRTLQPPITWLMQMTLARPELISLAAGFTDMESLPLAEVRDLFNEILDSPRDGRRALQYGSTAGDPELRRLTAARLQSQDGPGALPESYLPDRLFISSGSQQLLYVVSECLCDPGDIVLVEDPTYFVYLSILQSHGLRCRGIRLGAQGIDLVHLEETLARLKKDGDLRRVKLLYLVTYHQNPTGTTTTWETKRQALALLRRYERDAGHPIHLLEDAAYRELRFRGEDVPSALTVPRAADRVIYAGTFSKPFATGARVGFGVLPERMLRVVLRIKGNHDFGTSNLLQQLLKRALTTCRYEAHLDRLRQRYAHKAATMTRAIRAHLPTSVQWQEPNGGLYVWARLSPGVKSGIRSKLFRTALENQVLYVPGVLCYAEDPTRARPDHELRLSFGGASVSNLRTGIRRLGASLHPLLDSASVS